ncbi:MAG: response regulator, partial [Oscillospiraceae bacterium]|nr:response regulator [Oscillospiraceae bacterium]
TGIGISPEQQEKLFTAFEQAESGISRKYGGTGLGLVISQRIVRLMGGEIDLQSELGSGAKFTFNIKVQRADEPLSQNQAETANTTTVTSESEKDGGEFAGKRILVAEDIKINREILTVILQEYGVLIDCAENGREAIEVIQAVDYSFDLILMDVQMPEMDGLEATERIRNDLKLTNVPIIAMTANVFKDDIDSCLKAGMNDHLGKPLELDKMIEKLRRYL